MELSIIPRLKEEVVISTFDDGTAKKSYMISYHKRNWKISELVNIVICSIDGIHDSEYIKTMICQKHSIHLKNSEFENIISFLYNNGLLQGSVDSNDSQVLSNKMMWGRITIFPPFLVKRLRRLSFLYNKNVIIVGTCVILCWLVFICIFNSSAQIAQLIYSLKLSDIVICYIIIIFISIIHEFGHSVALLKNGENPGRIGAGIYFIMPVLFSDVTNTWKLSRYNRLEVDLGGLYFQGLFLITLYFTNILFFKYYLLKLAILFSAFQILGNFNPFIKLDGYWVLCDYLGVTNIQKIMKDVVLSSFRKQKPPDVASLGNSKLVVIYIYSTMFVAFFIYFFRIMLLSSRFAICNIYNDFQYFINNYSQVFRTDSSNILPFLVSRFSSVVVLVFLIKMLVSILKYTLKFWSEKQGKKHETN
jgi:hypothetical protein